MENAQIVICAKINDDGHLEVQTHFYDLQPLYDLGPLTLEKIVTDNFVKAVSFAVKVAAHPNPTRVIPEDV